MKQFFHLLLPVVLSDPLGYICFVYYNVYLCCLQMGQALWRLPPRQQQQLQEELADQLTESGGGKRDQGISTIVLISQVFNIQPVGKIFI